MFDQLANSFGVAQAPNNDCYMLINKDNSSVKLRKGSAEYSDDIRKYCDRVGQALLQISLLKNHQ